MTLPKSVTITRRRHALEGRTFRLLGALHRHGHEELLIVLEDGTKSLVPASWTDHVGAAATSAAATIGTLADLLAASVLARTPFPGREAAEVQAARKPPRKGDDHAALLSATQDEHGPVTGDGHWGVHDQTTKRSKAPWRKARARRRDRAAVLPGPGIDDGVLGDIGAAASSPGVGVCGPGRCSWGCGTGLDPGSFSCGSARSPRSTCAESDRRHGRRRASSHLGEPSRSLRDRRVLRRCLHRRGCVRGRRGSGSS